MQTSLHLLGFELPFHSTSVTRFQATSATGASAPRCSGGFLGSRAGVGSVALGFLVAQGQTLFDLSLYPL